MAERLAAGLLAAAAIALVARRAGSLSTSGAIAATLVGTAAVAAGWHWGALLVVYFGFNQGGTFPGAPAIARRDGRLRVARRHLVGHQGTS